MASSVDHATESFSSPNWGTHFVAVESVQELALNKPNDIPQRYIRSEEERPSSKPLPSLLTVPVVDMEKLLLPSNNHERQKEMSILSKACREWGFFQVVNHGIPHSLIDRIRGVANEFFSLSLDEKKKYTPQAGDPQGYGNMFVVDEDQKLDWGDLIALALMPKKLVNLALWPTTPADYRNTLQSYTTQMERVVDMILSLFAENLQLESDYFKENFGEDPMMTIRMNLYPPCPRPDLVLGLSPHSDGGVITLLLQDDQTEGLQVRKNNEWIPIQPIPYALVVNIGDLMEVMTNGIYKSIEHRAVTNKERTRLSIAMFYYAGIDDEVAPTRKVINEEHPSLYRKFKHQEYIQYYMNKQLNGKKSLANFAKICE
ncbi:codeine O-demethylase-like [Cryptomeria japonica]|uniref:codeine O-demethylase-like n=1 Tax=Cryptomeria japonica TaxID=3369 RepID=UPI0027DA22FE|nr:codeine O-demethylase-like [Cryptomeria japonica]